MTTDFITETDTVFFECEEAPDSKRKLSAYEIGYIEIQESITDGKKTLILREFLLSLADAALAEQLYHSIWPFSARREEFRLPYPDWYYPLYVGVPTYSDALTTRERTQFAIAHKAKHLADIDCRNCIVEELDNRFEIALMKILEPLAASDGALPGFKVILADAVVRSLVLSYYRNTLLMEAGWLLSKAGIRGVKAASMLRTIREQLSDLAPNRGSTGCGLGISHVADPTPPKPLNFIQRCGTKSEVIRLTIIVKLTKANEMAVGEWLSSNIAATLTFAITDIVEEEAKRYCDLLLLHLPTK